MGIIQAFRSSLRTATRLAARDVSADSSGRSALVLAPHPDDETLGCGATILGKLAAGTPVTVLIVTDGRHSHRSPALPPEALAALRRAEMAEAARRLGLPDGSVRSVGLVDGTAAAHEDELAATVRALILELRPDEVYATCADEPHPDHAAVARAARRAVAGADHPVRLLEYPVWLWASWPVRRGDRVGSTVDALRRVFHRSAVAVRTGPWLATKLHALEAHASQLRRPPSVPTDHDWPGLPADVLAGAADRVEVFFPITPRR